MPSAPATETKLLAFVGDAYERQRLRTTTIRNYLCAIVYVHKVSGLQDPRSGSLLSIVLDGMTNEDKERGREPKLRLGITGAKLKLLLESLDLNDFAASRYAVYASLSYYGGFRAGDLLRQQKNGCVLWDDIRFYPSMENPQYCVLLLRKSKTNQSGPGVPVTIPLVGGITCPIRLLKNYMRYFATRQADTPVFGPMHGSSFGYRQALLETRQRLTAVGLPSQLFGCHSFRIGMATTAAHRGLADWAIQTLGRWNSMCFHRYVRMSSVLVASLAASLSPDYEG